MMTKILLLIVLSAFILFSSCNTNSVKKVSGPYKQGNAVWAMSSGEKQAQWVGKTISASDGSSDPDDYLIALGYLGNQRIKLTLIDTAVTSKNLENFSARGRFKIDFTNAGNYDFIDASMLTNTFQSKQNRFILASSFGVNCGSDAPELKEIELTVTKGSNAIKEYTFEADGFKKVSRHLACK